MKKKLLAVLTLTLVFTLSLASPVLAAPAAGSSMGIVTVIHGVPGLTVDVYVNGALTLPNFEPNTITEPLKLPEGNYDIEIFPAGADPSGMPAISGSAFLPAGANASIIAHLTEGGMPTLSVFVNDLADLARKNARLVVRHTAAAPAVDVSLYQTRGDAMRFVGVLENLYNPNEASIDAKRGMYAASLAPAGTTDTIYGPVDLTLRPGYIYIVYAVGSLDDGSFTLLIQTICVKK